MQQLDLLAGPKQSQVTISWDKEELVGQLSDLCDSLLAEGFQWEDVQDVLKVVHVTICHRPHQYLSRPWLCVGTTVLAATPSPAIALLHCVNAMNNSVDLSVLLSLSNKGSTISTADVI